jgi:hypothetical protein
MLRRLIAATGTLLAVVAVPLAPAAVADGPADGHTVLALDGKVRCLLSTDDVPRGGGPMALCQLSNGQPIGAALYSQGKDSRKLDVALVHGKGQFYWDKGNIAPGQDTVVGNGQSVNINGWTVKDEGLRIRITNDASGHGLLLNEVDVRQF